MDQNNKNDSGVKFQDSGWRAVKYYREPQSPKIIRWMMRYSGGLIKNEKQANYVLIGFVAVVIIVAVFVLTIGGPKQPTLGPIPPGQFVP